MGEFMHDIIWIHIQIQNDQGFDKYGSDPQVTTYQWVCNSLKFLGNLILGIIHV